MNLTLTWLIIFIFLIFVEIATVNLVSIWFAIGAIASCILSIYVDNLIIQLGCFVITSTICLILTKSIISKIKNHKITPTNLDRVIGDIGIVTEEIDEFNNGEVKVDGKTWTATSKETLKVGTKVKIVSINGVKLNVKSIKEDD
ncbi:MAG TPA: NfeD family protein [Firmicutes bacterium]|nr:NfeD family protein [Bacillota bacterium]